MREFLKYCRVCLGFAIYTIEFVARDVLGHDFTAVEGAHEALFLVSGDGSDCLGYTQVRDVDWLGDLTTVSFGSGVVLSLSDVCILV